jgi:LysM repeat protein
MPNIPRVALLAGLVVLLAIALYFLPALLGLGSSGTGKPGASASPSAGSVASLEPSPTVAAAPTPQLYTIRKNETLSKIAKAHGLTLEELLAANPAIKNPNKISEGQQIILPVPSESPPNEVGGSAAPSAS